MVGFQLRVLESVRVVGPLPATSTLAVRSPGALFSTETTFTVAPTIGLEEPEDGLDLNFVPGVAQQLKEPEPGRPAIAISNCFGFGGHNTVLVMEPGSMSLGHGGAQATEPQATNGRQ